MAGPALSTLTQTIIGSLLVLSWLITIAAVYALIKVQNHRVQDQKDMSVRLETVHSNMVGAFESFKGTLDTLAKAEETSQQASQAFRDQLTYLASKVDMLLMRGGK